MGCRRSSAASASRENSLQSPLDKSGESLRLDPDTARRRTAISPLMTRDARLDTSGDISCRWPAHLVLPMTPVALES